MQLAEPEVPGQAGAGRRRDRLPADRHLGTARARPGGHRPLAAGHQGQRGRAHLPGQRDHHQPGQPGAAALGIINQYYWYRLRAEIGAGSIHSKITYFAPHDPGYVIDVSGAAVLKSSTHQAAAQRFLAFLVSKPAQEIIGRDSLSYEYPIASGRDHRRAGDAVQPAAAEPDHDRPSSATARRPSPCSARRDSCDCRAWAAQAAPAGAGPAGRPHPAAARSSRPAAPVRAAASLPSRPSSRCRWSSC